MGFMPKCRRNYYYQLDDETLTDALTKLAAGNVTTLETAYLRGWLPPKDTFESLVKKNKSLRKVLIDVCRNNDTDDDHVLLERAADFMKCIFRAPILEVLQINDRDYISHEKVAELEELYRTHYRHRRVHLRLFELDY